MKNRNASIKFSYLEIPIEPLFCTVWDPHESPAIRKTASISRTQRLFLRLRVAALGFWVILWENRNQNKWKLAVKTLENMLFASLLTKNACNTNEKGYKPSVMT